MALERELGGIRVTSLRVQFWDGGGGGSGDGDGGGGGGGGSGCRSLV